MSTLYTRCALAAWLCAIGFGADCSVGREVVGKRSLRLAEPPICEDGLDCEPPPSELELPERESGICQPEDACPAALLEELRAPGASVRNSRFALQAEAPTEFDLSGVRLEHVVLELSGPITLHVRDRSQLRNVELRLGASGGEPQVRVVDSELERVYVRSVEEDYVGSLVVERAEVFASSLEVRALELSTSSVWASSLSAQRAVLGHAAVNRSALACETCWASGGAFEDLRTDHCGELSFTGTRLEGGELGPCTHMLRLFLSDFNGSLVDGPVHTENSYMRDVRIGSRADTRFAAYQSDVQYSAFCAGALDLKLGQGSVVRCASCPAHEQDLPVCEFGDSPVKLETNLCTSLQEALAMCERPWPERQRPP